MALVACPECGKEVSSTALSCPACGFSVKDYYDQKEKEAEDKARAAAELAEANARAVAALEEFKKTHKRLILDDDAWFILFTTYDYMINRIAETSEDLMKYKKIRFDGGYGYPIGFCNGWFDCITYCYADIIKFIQNELGRFPNDEVKNNLEQLQHYSSAETVRSVILRWNDFVMTPFKTNVPVILQKADSNYALEVAQESQMGFGVLTSSFTAAALYAVQSSIKEAKAVKTAEENKQKYIDTAMSEIQRNVAKAWNEHFNEFLADVEGLHQLVIWEIGNIVFKGFQFSWKNVDTAFMDPDKKAMYLSRKAEIDEKIEEERQARMAVLEEKRLRYIAENSAIVEELSQLKSELNALGSALFGDKAKKRKYLKSEIAKKEKTISEIEPMLNATTAKLQIVDSAYIHTVYGRSSCRSYSGVRYCDLLAIKYNEGTNRYDVLNEEGICIEQLPLDFTEKYGVYREFTAKHYQGGCVDYADADCQELILLGITSVD